MEDATGMLVITAVAIGICGMIYFLNLIFGLRAVTVRRFTIIAITLVFIAFTGNAGGFRFILIGFLVLLIGITVLGSILHGISSLFGGGKNADGRRRGFGGGGVFSMILAFIAGYSIMDVLYKIADKEK